MPYRTKQTRLRRLIIALWTFKTGITAATIFVTTGCGFTSDVGRMIAIAGGSIGVWHYLLLRKRRVSLLMDKGLFRFIRHPMYLGEWLLVLGFAINLETWQWLPPVTSALAIIPLSEAEDIELARVHGNDHRHWRMRTRRLIPAVY